MRFQDVERPTCRRRPTGRSLRRTASIVPRTLLPCGSPDETNHVYVQDTRRDEIVREFDAPVYRD